MRVRVFLPVLLLAAVAAAGCAQPGYDAAKLQRELVGAGATPQQARCVTDGFMQVPYDPNQLASRSEPTLKELRTTRGILERCGIKNLAPPP